MYPLQIVIHPLGIRKVSKINVVAEIKVCDTEPHSRFASVEPPWIDTIHFKKIYVCMCRVFCAVLLGALRD